MRYQRKASVVLSEDDSTTPKQLRFADQDRETIEKDAIAEGGGLTQSVAGSAVDVALPMGAVSTGKWFYLFCDKPFTLKINGGAALTMAALKVNEMWVDFTSLSVSNPSSTDAMRLTWAIGGA